MDRRQKAAIAAIATVYALCVLIAEWVFSIGASDRLHAAADVAAVANSVALPVSLLATVLTLSPRR